MMENENSHRPRRRAFESWKERTTSSDEDKSSLLRSAQPLSTSSSGKEPMTKVMGEFIAQEELLYSTRTPQKLRMRTRSIPPRQTRTFSNKFPPYCSQHLKKQRRSYIPNPSSISSFLWMFTIFCLSLSWHPSACCSLVRADDSNKLRRHASSSLGTTTTDKEHSDGSRRISKDNDNFLVWCRRALGITTHKLQVQIFDDYPNYLQAMKDRTDVFWEPLEDSDEEVDFTTLEREDYFQSVEDYDSISVRGLAASEDIQKGDLLISIPRNALLTVPNLIDRDPALGPILGPEPRREFGWNDNDMDDRVDFYYELPLIAVGLLHHLSLHRDSPLYQYLTILQQEETNDPPFLWPREILITEATYGVRSVARGIDRDVHELYEAVVQVLIEAHPDLFGEDANISRDDDEEDHHHHIREETEHNDRHDEGFNWAFSFEKFQWAFAIVNSRHWHMALVDPTITSVEGEKDDDFEEASSMEQPPASMPTEEWIEHQKLRREEEDREERGLDHEIEQDTYYSASSFLAPVADLLNFGPPCTHAEYNSTTQTFDIVATCDIMKGQEVTFWYSDACADVILGNYGFTHPMVPPCDRNEWKRHAIEAKEVLETQLVEAYQDLDLLAQNLESLEAVLASCTPDCCGIPDQEPTTHMDARIPTDATQQAEVAKDKDTDDFTTSSSPPSLARSTVWSSPVMPMPSSATNPSEHSNMRRQQQQYRNNLVRETESNKRPPRPKRAPKSDLGL